jgi:L-ribulose-5-phosphate 3-epimerase
MTQPKFSFGTTNFVAQQLEWKKGAGGWGAADPATNEYFSPIETFRERFGGLLGAVRELGFENVDLWTAHLNGAWATDEHYAIARDLLAEHGLGVTQIMGGFYTKEDLERSSEAAAAIGATVVGGIVTVPPEDIASLAPLLRERGVRVGFENHKEPTAETVLAQVEAVGEDDVVGTTLDTGWYGARGYDPLRAMDVLNGRILAVHLKDVPELDAHHSCAWGEGIVPIQQCIEKLLEIGYDGPYMIDHEPMDHDPSDECRRMLAQAREWLAVTDPAS